MLLGLTCKRAMHNGNARGGAEHGTCGTLRMRGNASCGWACVKLLEDGCVVDSHMGDRRGPS